MLRGQNTYQRARLLQDWFRNQFTYDLSGVRAGHSEDAIETFLESKRGYCEQFAGTFAAMARSRGIPARVAVGFTPGRVDEDSDGSAVHRARAQRARLARGVDQPGRVGALRADARAGCPWRRGVDRGRRAAGRPGPDRVPRPHPRPPAPRPFRRPCPTRRPQGPNEVDSVGRGGTGGGGPLSPLVRVGIAAGAAVLAVAAWVGLLAAARTLRTRMRRHRATTGAAQVRLAWLESTEAVGRVAPPMRPAETHAEFAARVRPVIGPASRPLHRLAGLATASEWSDQAVDPERVDDARTLSREIDHEIRETPRTAAAPARLVRPPSVVPDVAHGAGPARAALRSSVLFRLWWNSHFGLGVGHTGRAAPERRARGGRSRVGLVDCSLRPSM